MFNVELKLLWAMCLNLKVKHFNTNEERILYLSGLSLFVHIKLVLHTLRFLSFHCFFQGFSTRLDLVTLPQSRTMVLIPNLLEQLVLVPQSRTRYVPIPLKCWYMFSSFHFYMPWIFYFLIRICFLLGYWMWFWCACYALKLLRSSGASSYISFDYK